MNIHILTKNNLKIVHILELEYIISESQQFLDLITTLGYEHDTNYYAIEKYLLAPKFFDLTSGLAGDIMQKCMIYGIKVQVIGDYSHIESKAFKDLMYECNQQGNFTFVNEL